MKMEKTWSASSKPEKLRRSEELVNMIGKWNVGIEVTVTNPCTYAQDYLEAENTREEIRFEDKGNSFIKSDSKLI